MIHDYPKRYKKELIKHIEAISDKIINKIVEVIFEAYKNGRQIFIMGNGGSAATASHFACDLGKGTAFQGKPRFKVMSLNDNVPLLTALSNDFGYDHVFLEQLKNLLNPNDIVIVISASGNSPNIVKALEYANEKGAYTISLVGFKGGLARKLGKLCIHSEIESYEIVEDIHLILEHIISSYFKMKISKSV